jgi:LCP family protein required for cell wall assembly
MGKKARTVLRPVRSAFAAAFLSFLLPGLGQAYLRYWLRAALWMVLPIAGLVAAAIALAGGERKEFLAQLTDPDVLMVVLLLVVLDGLYRLAAVLDAWRLGRDRFVGTPTTRTASLLGVGAIALVLVSSHMAVAMPVRLAQDVVGTLDGGGDTSAIPDISELPSELQAVVSATAAPSSLEPGASAPAASASAAPTQTIEPWDPSKRLDILLVGLDSGRPGEKTYLTDTMMVVSIHPRTGRMALISLPRDTVNVPLPKSDDFRKARAVFGNSYAGRINSLYITARLRDDLFPGNDRQRGYRALMGALSELYGLDIGHYVSVDLKSFRGAVNAFGGLVVDVQLPLRDDGYSASDGRGHLKLYIPPGIQHMNGQEALAYARSRKSTSDFDRAARQQYVVDALKDQVDLESLLEPGTIAALREQFETYVTTNIPAKMLPQLVLLAMDLDTRAPESLVLSPEKGYSVTQPDFDIVPNVSRIRKAVKNVFKSGSKKAAASPNPSSSPSPELDPSASPEASPPVVP